MTTEEKVKHMTEVTLVNTQRECDQSLMEYKARTDKYYNEKLEAARKKAELRIKAVKEECIKKNKKEYANEQLAMKRKLSSVQLELKRRLWQEVESQLKAFADTEEYMQLLEKQIKELVNLAAGNAVNIYMDAADDSKRSFLEKKFGCVIKLADRPIIGGTLGEIPAKNILVDNTFATKVDSIMEDYTFKG